MWLSRLKQRMQTTLVVLRAKYTMMYVLLSGWELIARTSDSSNRKSSRNWKGVSIKITTNECIYCIDLITKVTLEALSRFYFFRFADLITVIVDGVSI